MATLLISEHHGLRLRTEQFIRDTYFREYGARLGAFPSKLIAMLDEGGDISCAAGIRSCHDGFFSECYLDASIETLLAQATRKNVTRETVFEVSTFASRAPNSVIRFISQIIDYGEMAGFDWAFFTLTSRLQLLFDRVGLELIPLAAADVARVPNPAGWGSYYEMNPKVYAGGRESLAGLFESRHRIAVHA
jgi:hypothetical protein